MMTYIKQYKSFDKIVEISKTGTILQVISGDVYVVSRIKGLADNKFLKFLDRNYYKCVRSDKKAVQEYKYW